MRMPSLNAALGLAQMKKIRLLIKRKRDIFNKYHKFFNKKNNEFFSLYEENKSQKSNFWLQALVLKKKYRNKTKKVKKNFDKLNISTRLMWKPISKIDYFKNYPSLI